MKERYRQQRLVPNAIEPRGVVVAATSARRTSSRSGARRRSRTSSAFWLAVVTGIPETKLRVIAPDVGGGFGSKLDVYAEEALALVLRAEARPPGEVDRGAHARATCRRSTAATSSRRSSSRRPPRGRSPPCGPAPRRTWARTCSSSRPGIPLLGAWLYGGVLRHRGLRRRVRRRLHEHDADRRLPRRRPAGGDVSRSSARSTRSRASSTSIPSSCGGRTSSRELPDRRSRRADDRLRRLRRAARPRARAARLRRAPARAGARRERGDTKLLGVGFSTYVEMCGLAPSRILGAIRYAAGGWDAAHDPLPADRDRAGGDRHLAARPGPRDDVLADRRRPARRRLSTTWRCCTATRRSSPLGMDTYGSRSLDGRRHRALNATDKVIDKARRSRRTSSRSPRRT